MKSASSFVAALLTASTAAAPFRYARQAQVPTVNVEFTNDSPMFQRPIPTNGEPFILPGQRADRSFKILSVQANNGQQGALCAAFDNHNNLIQGQDGRATFNVLRDLVFENPTEINAVTCSDGRTMPASPVATSGAGGNNNANIPAEVNVGTGVNSNTFATSFIPTDNSIILVADTNLRTVPQIDEANVQGEGIECTFFSDAGATVPIAATNNPFTINNDLDANEPQTIVSIRCAAAGSAPTSPPANNNVNNNANEPLPEDKPWVGVSFEVGQDEFRQDFVWVGQPFNIQGSQLASGNNIVIAAEIININGHGGVACEAFALPNAQQTLGRTFDADGPRDPIGAAVGSVLCSSQ